MAGVTKNWTKVVFKRRLLIMALLLVQILFFVILIENSSRTYHYLSYGLEAISVIVCVRIINRKEKPAYKLTWIFIIMLVPIFGGIMYVVFYSQSNPRRLRRLFDRVIQLIKPYYHLLPDRLNELEHSTEEHSDEGSPLENDHREFHTQAHYLQEFAGFPVCRKTETEYFPSGEAFFADVIPELEKAERYIFMEFFIMRQGKMLDPILEILERKARAGLDVRVIYDDLGCFLSLPGDFKKSLEARGIKCLVFNPFTPIFSSLQNNRDHRKIISIDGKTAYTGGVNLADEYINQLDRFGHWKDSALRVRGEAAWSFTLIFLRMWNLRLRKGDDIAVFFPWRDEECAITGDGYVQPYADSPLDDENVGEHVYFQILNRARKYVYINTPYLAVDDNMLSAITLAAKSGVDVRIITPHHWDKWYVAIVSRSYYRQLIGAGVKIYEYSAGFNHSKTFVCDDRIAVVGTTNLDFRSLYLHFECGAVLYASKTVLSVKEDFLATLSGCHEITERECSPTAFHRLLQDVLRIFAPLM